MATVYLFMQDNHDTANVTSIADSIHNIADVIGSQQVITPISTPLVPRTATVEAMDGNLGIHSGPSASAPVLANAPDAATLGVYARTGEWYFVCYHDTQGYVSGENIVLHY